LLNEPYYLILEQAIDLIAGKTATTIPVSCVEEGRWHYDTHGFASGKKVMHASLRREAQDCLRESLGRGEGHFTDQGRIWNHIAEKSRRMNVDSPTRAMSDVFDHVKDRLSTYTDTFHVIEQQVGAMFAIDGKVIGLECFRCHDTFRRFFDKLVNSYAMDALESDVTLVEVDILRGAGSAITSGQLAVAFYQAQPVTDKVQPRTLRAGIYTEAGQLISDKVIDKISAALNEKADVYETQFSNLGIKWVLVDSCTIKAHPRLLVSGVWCSADIEHSHSEDRNTSPWILSALKPIQLSRFDFVCYINASKQFDTQEWIGLLNEKVPGWKMIVSLPKERGYFKNQVCFLTSDKAPWCHAFRN
jgi:hypothetical protein